MAEKDRIKVEPDLDFIQDVLESGGESLKKCFQCGTCSVVCNLAPEDSPFPRKEMIWAQWGLKDKLTTDPHVWACFQCGDCTAFCPRGAKPGDVLGAVRKKVIEGLSFPSFMGKAVGDPHYWPLLFLLPALILGAVIAINGTGFMSESPVVYGEMISHIQMNIVFPFFTGLAALAFLVGINRMWKGASGQSLIEFIVRMDKPRIVGATIAVIGDIITHKDFSQCDSNRWRKLAHFLVFWAFIGLLATTALAIVVLVLAEYLHNYSLGEYPLNWYHPIKWLGNASAVALIVGSWLMIQNRRQLVAKGEINSSYFDLFFLYIVFGVGVTGFIAQVLRFADVPIVAYPTYFVHLVLVFALLIYSPYSKFAHFMYRTVALIHQRYQEMGVAAAEPAQEFEAPAEAA